MVGRTAFRGVRGRALQKTPGQEFWLIVAFAFQGDFPVFPTMKRADLMHIRRNRVDATMKGAVFKYARP